MLKSRAVSISICGINHKTAALALREQWVINEKFLPEALRQLSAQTAASEVLILSTCNRLEIYAVDTEKAALYAWLSHYFAVAIETLEPLLYYYKDEAAVQHILRLACGTDSMIIGEQQILGQLKTAYNVAVQSGTIGKQFNDLLPFTFSSAKKIRTDTAINRYPVSVAYAAVSLAKQIFTDLQQTSVLLIGAGSTVELAAQYLFELPVQRIIIANRTLERAKKIAQNFSAQSITISEIPRHLPHIDIIFSSTSSQLPLIGKGLIERILKKRRHKPIFMVDLAVPRDIEPEVGELEDIYLYNIDDLEHVIKENQQDRLLAAAQAEKMILLEAAHFKHWQNFLKSVPAIRDYRQQVEQMRAANVVKALASLQRGEPAVNVINQLSHQLANKLMHQPTIQMRQAAYQGQHDLLVWTKKMLDSKL